MYMTAYIADEEVDRQKGRLITPPPPTPGLSAISPMRNVVCMDVLTYIHTSMHRAEIWKNL